MTTLVDSTASNPLPQLATDLAAQTGLLAQFRAHRILTPFQVPVRKGTLPIHVSNREVKVCKRDKQGNFLRIDTQLDRADYECEESGVEVPLFDTEVENLASLQAPTRASWIDRMQMVKARQGVLTLLTAREVAAATLLFSTDTFGAAFNEAVAAASQFNSTATVNPLDVIMAALDTAAANLGVRPNKMAIPDVTFRYLVRNNLVAAEISYRYGNEKGADQPVAVLAQTLAAMLGLEEVIVLPARKVTTHAPAAETVANVWDTDYTLLFYQRPEDPDASLGFTFTYDGDLERSAMSDAEDLEINTELLFRVEGYREEKITADIIRVRENINMQVTNVNAGYLLTDCLA